MNLIEKFRLIAEKNRLIYLGAVRCEERPEFEQFKKWLDEGIPPFLGYLSNYLEVRQNPALIMPGAQTSIIVAVQYELARKKSAPRIAGYANARDYHKLMKSRMHSMISDLKQELIELTEARFLATVDSAPVLERALASQQSGFIGKNTCYIHPKLGSALLIGEIFLDRACADEFELHVDPKSRSELGGCGTCRRCQVHCPTGALNRDYQIDPSRCLSYWSIENRDIVPIEFWPHFAKFWYGCDICQNVCPYNRDVEFDLLSLVERKFDTDMDLVQVATMDQSFYERNFGGTPMVRAKIDGLRRNALIAMVVVDDPRLSETIAQILAQQPSEMIRKTIDQIPTYHLMKNGGTN